MALEIITNNAPREIIYYDDLTENEKKDFDWIDNDNGEESDYSFFRYKGNVYCLADFMRINKNNNQYIENDDGLKEWDGYHSDSFFSGMLVKYVYSNDMVIVGRYFSTSDI